MQTRFFHLRRVACAVLFLAGLAWSRPASADTFILGWSPNPEPEVTGYLVFIGTEPGAYSMTVDVGSATTYSFSADIPGQTYYFALRAYAGAELSPLSEEISGTTNSAPTLEQPPNRTGAAGTPSTLQLQGADVDGNPLSYSAVGLPAGLLLTQSTGLISGVPTAVGVHDVTVTVSDGMLWVSRSFTWTVQPTTWQNSAPSLLNPGAQASMAGLGMALQLVASDPDGQTLRFTATGLPSGIELAPATGRISGTTSATGVYDVVASVTDGELTTSQSFTVTVTAMSSSAASAIANAKRPRSSSTTSSTSASDATQSVRPSGASEPVTYTGATARVRTTATSNGVAPVGGTGGNTTGIRSVLPTGQGPTTVGSLQQGATTDGGTSLAATGEQAASTAIPRSTGLDGATVGTGEVPTVRIQTPLDGAVFGSTAVTIFTATADDAEEGDISARIVWTSSIDGRLGTGAMIQRALTGGTHVVTASVSDDSGNSRNIRIVVIIAR